MTGKQLISAVEPLVNARGAHVEMHFMVYSAASVQPPHGVSCFYWSFYDLKSIVLELFSLPVSGLLST